MAPEHAASVDRRQAILDAALELFAERGFHGTAVPLVAERAGVGAGTVYRYFESKEALVNTLYRECKTTLGKTLLDEFPVDAPPRAQFAECWRRMARFALEHSRAFTFLELHHHAPYLDAESRAMDLRVLGPVHAFVVTAQGQGLLKELRPELLMAIVYGALIGIVRLSESGHLPIAELAASLAAAETCAWEAVRR